MGKRGYPTTSGASLYQTRGLETGRVSIWLCLTALQCIRRLRSRLGRCQSYDDARSGVSMVKSDEAFLNVDEAEPYFMSRKSRMEGAIGPEF